MTGKVTEDAPNIPATLWPDMTLLSNKPETPDAIPLALVPDAD
jgi:hypothetical protein